MTTKTRSQTRVCHEAFYGGFLLLMLFKLVWNTKGQQNIWRKYEIRPAGKKIKRNYKYDKFAGQLWQN